MSDIKRCENNRASIVASAMSFTMNSSKQRSFTSLDISLATYSMGSMSSKELFVLALCNRVWMSAMKA